MKTYNGVKVQLNVLLSLALKAVGHMHTPAPQTHQTTGYVGNRGYLKM
jgi:hypothetical protein